MGFPESDQKCGVGLSHLGPLNTRLAFHWGDAGGTSLDGKAIERNWEVDADPWGEVENSNFMAERENP